MRSSRSGSCSSRLGRLYAVKRRAETQGQSILIEDTLSLRNLLRGRALAGALRAKPFSRVLDQTVSGR